MIIHILDKIVFKVLLLPPVGLNANHPDRLGHIDHLAFALRKLKEDNVRDMLTTYILCEYSRVGKKLCFFPWSPIALSKAT